jgi:Glycosyl transferases group 1/Glycosyl transferase 4-like domain
LKLLLLSFYYSPDLCAGSFRTAALVKALLGNFSEDAHIELITTLPNRYSTFSSEALELEKLPRITIHRIKLPAHSSGMVDQAKAFISYALQVLKIVQKGDYDLVFGTSSRLMTAALSSFVSRWKRLPLYLDIRDIFVDTIVDVLPPKTLPFARPIFSHVERWTFNQAERVNLVSRGFAAYFQARYPQLKYSFFTNGIDAEFLSLGNDVDYGSPVNPKLTILYAGNMGEGQGLHSIIPLLAKRFEGRLKFRLIGDGGRKARLEQALSDQECSNVELIPPVNRDQLLIEYRKADVLFLHLNDYAAFRKVLPSKLFEYAAVGKPIWAGVSGYAADFVNAEIDNATVFSPCAVDEATRAFEALTLKTCNRTRFVEKYSRSKIMHDMATDILTLMPRC